MFWDMTTCILVNRSQCLRWTCCPCCFGYCNSFNTDVVLALREVRLVRQWQKSCRCVGIYLYHKTRFITWHYRPKISLTGTDICGKNGSNLVASYNIPFSKLTRLSLKDRLLPHQIAIFVDGRWLTWPRIYWHQYTSRDQDREQGLAIYVCVFHCTSNTNN
jgi:hypothetical protein